MIETEVDATATDTAFLKWPPPGLERTQGDMLRIATSAALSGVFLVLPLVFVAGRVDGFSTFGPFADAWWVQLGLATIGLAFTLDTLVRASRTLRRVGRARQSGYRLSTVAYVLCDSGRDMGFLLSGERHFSVMEEREREAIAAIRLAAAVLVTGAGLWLVLAMPVALFLAARGAFSPAEMMLFTLAPSFLGYTFGGVATVVHQGRVRRARRVWYRQPWSADLASEEVAAWHRTAPGGPLDLEPDEGGARPYLIGGGIVGGLAALVVIPVLTLAPASAVAPILTTVSAPSLDTYRPRAARAEAFRSYTVDGDVSLSASVAGQLLQDLTFVGDDREPAPGEKGPSVRFEEGWYPDAENGAGPMQLEPHWWADSLLARVDRGLSTDQLEYMDELAGHPASELFSQLATATSLDAGSARWETPFPAGTTMATVPVPRFGAVRRAAEIQMARAAVALSSGRVEEAELRIREVITVGYLLADDGPTLIDNLIGVTLVEGGGSALAELFRASGRVEQAAELSRLVLVAEGAAGRLPARLNSSPEGFVNSLPDLVLDTTAVRGIRWEYFINLATIAPCMNVHRMVFGPGQEYSDFVEEARAALVRFPSDEALFELARYGWIGGADLSGPTWVTWLASLFMNVDENSCATMVRHMALAEGL
ncbi:MAG: hypothetical protein AAF389_00525 [Gemmatimonadota bacterium]